MNIKLVKFAPYKRWRLGDVAFVAQNDGSRKL